MTCKAHKSEAHSSFHELRIGVHRNHHRRQFNIPSEENGNSESRRKSYCCFHSILSQTRDFPRHLGNCSH